MIVNVIAALLISALIGWDRESAGKDFGFRSSTIVCLSICFLMIMNARMREYGIHFDFARIPAHAIMSIGFLGGGVLIYNKKNVEGVTTAAVMLSLVVIGLLCGIGEIYLASGLGLLVWIILKSKMMEIKLRNKYEFKKFKGVK